jgi:hypothetical protein
MKVLVRLIWISIFLWITQYSMGIAATVTSITPPEGSEIAANHRITITFDNPATNVTVNGTSAMGAGTTWRWEGDLTGQTGIHIAWTNEDGSAGEGKIVAYTVKPADTEPPKIVSSKPKDGDKDQDPEKLNADGIEIKFSEPIKYIDVYVTFERKYLEPGLWFTELLDDGTTAIVFMLKGGTLPYGAKVVLGVNAEDLAGNKLEEAEIIFTTIGYIPPPKNKNIELVGQILGDLRRKIAGVIAAENIARVTVVGNYAYITAVAQGLRIVDVSTPSAPVEVGFYQSPPEYANSVTVVGNYAYITTGGALRIVDVSTPSAPTEVGFYQTHGWAVDVTVVGSYAYIIDVAGFLRIIDVSTPSAPVEVGFYQSPAEYANSVTVVGNYAYITEGSKKGGLRIIDVSTPSVPVEVGFYQSPVGRGFGVTVVGSYAYVIIGSKLMCWAPWLAWVAPSNLCKDGLSIVDISTPSAPSEVSFYEINDLYLEDITVLGSYAYIAGGNGIRVFDVSTPSSPSEVGFYQTPGEATGVSISDDLIYVTDAKGGMSILRYTGTIPKGYENVFLTNLEPGLNIMSLPLKPIKPYTARSLAEKIDATVVIKLDEARQRFVGFTIDDPGDGFPIEGSKGYIVNVEEGKMVKFEGSAWTNQPPIEAAPSGEGRNSAWAFVMNVEMEDAGYRVQVKNQSTGASSMTEALGNGRYSGVWADLTRQPVMKVGDVLEVTVSDNTGIVGTLPYTVTRKDILRAFVTIPLDAHALRPIMTMLYQNYPNPFNPETWIPFKLATDSPATIGIYNAKGQLIRTIALGNKNAGVYMTRDKAAYWDGRDNFGEKVASGVYFYQLRAEEFKATKKMVILK